MSQFRSLREPLYLLALLPLSVAVAVWWQEAMWFKASVAEVIVQLSGFTLVVAGAIYPASLFALSAVKSRLRLVLLAIALSAAAIFIAREAVIALVAWGYSQERHAYTSVVALAASKRGLLFVLCSAAVPLLIAGLLSFTRGSSAGASNVSP